MSRTSTFSGPKNSLNPSNRPKSKDEPEKSIWSSMLESVASGKKLPEKDLIVLGGSSHVQKDFLETLSSDVSRRPQDRFRKKPPVANHFALGYTYQDVLDADNEDVLARMSIYFMSDPSPALAPLLKPLLTPHMIPETLLVILLDWNEPWSWAKQLRRWISFVNKIVDALDKETGEVADQIMKEWQQRKRGGIGYEFGGTASSETSVVLPLGDGEWDLPLGLPLAVVCHNAEKITSIEMDHHWREEDFDFVLQTLRTILLRHGASLIYTSKSAPNSLSTLIYSSLGIHSSLKKQALKHNVIDRDKILIPPNWDSFGKIRVLRDGFDVEKISALWANDLDLEQSQSSATSNGHESTAGSNGDGSRHREEVETVLGIYTSTITEPAISRSHQSTSSKTEIEISPPSHQDFLTSQSEVIERLKAEEAKASSASTNASSENISSSTRNHAAANTGTIDQIGPVQVNMGGIQVDAGDALRRMKSGRGELVGSSSTPGHNNNSSSSAGMRGGGMDGTGGDPGTPSTTMATPEREMKAQNEALNNFFTGLMKRGQSGSPRNTPGQEGKRSSSTPREKAKEDGGAKRLFTKE